MKQKYKRELLNIQILEIFKLDIKNPETYQLVKVRKLKSLSTQVPKVSKPNPAMNIINATTL